MSRSSTLHNTIVTAGLLILATVISLALFIALKNTTNVAVIYILTVLLIAMKTDGYVPGIAASFVSILCINCIFTYPYLELNFSMTGYPLTFISMMLISTLTSTMATHLKTQAHDLAEREHMLMDAEKEKMRANLLRAISHDLRTPLTGIIGTSSTYLDRSDSLNEEEKKNLVKAIEEDANWLLQMVENLLSVTRIRGESAGVATTLEPLEEVVPSAVQRFHKRFPDAQVHVSIPEEFVMIPLDATLIQQVIINLLENAVYHGNTTAPIDFTVSLIDGFAKFSIKDYGRGIREDLIDTLFDGYASSSNQSSDSRKGMGIGLSICKTIINAHHGEIYARNHSAGAEFIFTLPKGVENYES